MQLSCMAGLLLQIGRRTVTLDTGLKPARVARADLPPDCVIGSVRPPTAPRKPGAQRVLPQHAWSTCIFHSWWPGLVEALPAVLPPPLSPRQLALPC